MSSFSQTLLDALVAFPVLPDTFNPWTSSSADDAPGNGPAARRERLAAHVGGTNVRLVLVGEAPGWVGCRSSGIPFTSEALLMAGAIPHVPQTGRLSLQPKPLAERSAQVVWDTLYRARAAESVVLWNSFSIHPHQAGKPLTNRTPKTSEMAAGRSVIDLLRQHYHGVPFVAVGQKAAEALRSLGCLAEAIRHPAYGGDQEFRAGLLRYLGV